MSDATTEMPRVPPQPTTIPRTPMEPETRAWFLGTLAVTTLFFATVVAVSSLITSSDEVGDRSKASQVESCSNIEDSNAAFLCVEQVDD